MAGGAVGKSAGKVVRLDEGMAVGDAVGVTLGDAVGGLVGEAVDTGRNRTGVRGQLHIHRSPRSWSGARPAWGGAWGWPPLLATPGCEVRIVAGLLGRARPFGPRVSGV